MGVQVAMEEHTGPVVASADDDPGIFAVSGFLRDMAAVDPLSTRGVTDLSDVARSGSSGLGALVGMLHRSPGGRAALAPVSPHRSLRRVSEVQGLREAVGDRRDGAVPALGAARPQGAG